MNEELKAHLLARRRELETQIAPLQTALGEVNNMLHFLGVHVSEHPKRVRHVSGKPRVIAVLSAAGDEGLSWKEAAAAIPDLKPTSVSGYLSLLKQAGRADHVRGRYILKPEFRISEAASDPAP